MDDDLPLRWVSGWDLMVELRRTQHRIEVAMDQCLEAFGISYAQYRALEAILARKQPHIAGLARHLELTRHAVQRSAAKLERAGYVDIERDGGLAYLAATAQARRQLGLIREFGDIPARIEQALPERDRRPLTHLLVALERATRPPRRPL